MLVRSERRGEGPPLWPGAVPVEGGRLVRSRDGIEAEAYRLFRVDHRARASRPPRCCRGPGTEPLEAGARTADLSGRDGVTEMQIRIPRGWEIPERQATPEHLVMGRRKALRRWVPALAGAGRRRPGARALPALPPAMRNTRFAPGPRHQPPSATSPPSTTTTNSAPASRSAARRSACRSAPGRVKVEGMVETPARIRHRRPAARPCRSRSASIACAASRPGRWWCPGPASRSPRCWTQVKPLASARYVAFETAAMPGGHAGAAAILVPLALYRGLHHRGGRATSCPSWWWAPTASRCRRRMAGRSASTSPGNTASRPASRW